MHRMKKMIKKTREMKYFLLQKAFLQYHTRRVEMNIIVHFNKQGKVCRTEVLNSEYGSSLYEYCLI